MRFWRDVAVAIALAGASPLATAHPKPPDEARPYRRTPLEEALQEAVRAIAKGDFAAAEPHLQRARKLAPNHAPTYRLWAALYRRTNKPIAEVRMLRRYLVLAPQAADAETMRARIAELTKKKK